MKLIQILCVIISGVICVTYGLTETTFMVTLQSSGEWSKNEWIKYEGKIPQLREFTTCHWQKVMYFALDETEIWSYCFRKLQSESTLKCVQLYYHGNRDVANRDIIFQGYF